METVCLMSRVKDETVEKNVEIKGFRLYGDIQSALSQLIRTAFIPSDDMKFYVAVFSAIEARGIACSAKEN